MIAEASHMVLFAADLALINIMNILFSGCYYETIVNG
jgi:hypothetical protein